MHDAADSPNRKEKGVQFPRRNENFILSSIGYCEQKQYKPYSGNQHIYLDILMCVS